MRWIAGGMLLSASALAAAQPAAPAISSPNGSVRFELTAPAAGHLAYRVTLEGQAVIEPSDLVLRVDGADLGAGVALGEIETYTLDETYATRGVHAEAVARCRGARIPVRHVKSGTRYTLEVRVFDDGLGLRFIVPGREEERRVPDEASVFTLPRGSDVWFHDFDGHYEGIHVRRAITEIPEGVWAAPPVTFKLPGGLGYASLTEAALIGYAGMALQADGQRGFVVRLGHDEPVSYPFALRNARESLDRVKHLAIPAAITGTITTPWRVVMIGKDLNTLVNSDIVTSLSPPPDPTLFPDGLETAWLKPGRAVWRYLDGGESTFEGAKGFSRLAAELRFEHNVVEGYWTDFTDEQLRELVAYSKERGVGIWLWRHSRDITDPADRRAFFARCHDLGVVGVKLDFFDHEAKEVIDLYQAALRDAAELQLMVNFHGANKPTGEARTWPNEMVREAICGMEYRSVAARARHDTTLPFTRFLAGYADYTPVIFGERRRETSWAHQMATAAVFTAPLMVYAANPQTILDNPAAPKQPPADTRARPVENHIADMIRSLPSVWDETRVLPGSEIGEVAAYARRSGETWFLAVLNGPEARTLTVPLTFLGTGWYRSLLIRDRADEAAAIRAEPTVSRRSDSLTIDLREGGGFIARFVPAVD